MKLILQSETIQKKNLEFAVEQSWKEKAWKTFYAEAVAQWILRNF